jgi:preprotein translocase subunit SecA
MNNQRRAIYAERRRVLEGQDLKEQVVRYAEKTMDDIVNYYIDPDLPPEEWDLEKLVSKSREFVSLFNDLTPAQIEDMTYDEIKVYMREEVRRAYDVKETDIDKVQAGLMRQAERFFILQQIDTLWREHLQSMDALRESVGLRGYGQKDPLIEYKQEGYEMFLEMMTDIRRNVVYSMFQFSPERQAQAELPKYSEVMTLPEPSSVPVALPQSSAVPVEVPQSQNVPVEILRSSDKPLE